MLIWLFSASIFNWNAPEIRNCFWQFYFCLKNCKNYSLKNLPSWCKIKQSTTHMSLMPKRILVHNRVWTINGVIGKKGFCTLQPTTSGLWIMLLKIVLKDELYLWIPSKKRLYLLIGTLLWPENKIHWPNGDGGILLLNGIYCSRPISWQTLTHLISPPPAFEDWEN